MGGGGGGGVEAAAAAVACRPSVLSTDSDLTDFGKRGSEADFYLPGFTQIKSQKIYLHSLHVLSNPVLKDILCLLLFQRSHLRLSSQCTYVLSVSYSTIRSYSRFYVFVGGKASLSRWARCGKIRENAPIILLLLYITPGWVCVAHAEYSKRPE